jgi:hypothetical protein
MQQLESWSYQCRATNQVGWVNPQPGLSHILLVGGAHHTAKLARACLVMWCRRRGVMLGVGVTSDTQSRVTAAAAAPEPAACRPKYCCMGQETR